MKKILKIVTWMVGIILIAFTCGYIWIRGIWKDKIAEEGLDQLVSAIQSYEPLPQNFMETVDKVSPNIFDNGAFGHFYDCAILRRKLRPRPCMQVVRMAPQEIRAKTDPRMSVGNPHELSIILELETRVSQAECYAYVMNNWGYYPGWGGIYKASETYFCLPLDQLTFDQQIELIAILHSPAVCDPVTRPENLYREAAKLKAQVWENETTP